MGEKKGQGLIAHDAEDSSPLQNTKHARGTIVKNIQVNKRYSSSRKINKMGEKKNGRGFFSNFSDV